MKSMLLSRNMKKTSSSSTQPRVDFIINVIRWILSIAFFSLAISKTQYLFQSGFDASLKLVKLLNAPEILKYYMLIAIIVELFAAIGLWVRSVYRTSILFMLCLTVLGGLLSIYSIVYKLNSDCGCGLLGDNEYGLLLQKVVILFLLGLMYRSRDRLVPETSGTISS